MSTLLLNLRSIVWVAPGMCTDAITRDNELGTAGAMDGGGQLPQLSLKGLLPHLHAQTQSLLGDAERSAHLSPLDIPRFALGANKGYMHTTHVTVIVTACPCTCAQYQLRPYKTICRYLAFSGKCFKNIDQGRS